jgi:hypothetical protein
MPDSSSDIEPRYPEEFLDIIATLNQCDARFVVIGGVAMVLLGSAHLTRDVDIYYSRTPENVAKLVSAIAPHHPRLRGAPADLPFQFDERTFRSVLNMTLVTDLGDLDLIGDAMGAPSFEDVYDRSVTLEVDSRTIRVSSIPDLIAMKRAAGRPKDIAHIYELEALQRLQEEQAE